MPECLPTKINIDVPYEYSGKRRNFYNGNVEYFVFVPFKRCAVNNIIQFENCDIWNQSQSSTDLQDAGINVVFLLEKDSYSMCNN